jgi:hypothetical protein
LRGELEYTNLEDYKMNRKDILIQRLAESLVSPSMTIEDVINILKNELYEKSKKRELEKVQSKIDPK